MTDRQIIYVTSFLRALATGLIGVLLAIYLKNLNFKDSQIGLVIASGLFAGTLAIGFEIVFADRYGRKSFLLILTGFSVVGALLAIITSSPTAMIAASFFGFLNGMGRDRGPLFVLEQAILPETVSQENRTMAYAWYNLIQDIGHALGGLLAGLPAFFRHFFPYPEVINFKLAIFIYTIFIMLCVPFYIKLSPEIEVHHEIGTRRISAEGRKTVWKISSVFALDSFSGGFLATALLALFFYQRFGVNESVIGILFLVARVANAFSHPVAAWLAKHFGLINTMVFTHVPSSIFLILAVFSPTFPIAVVFFLLRESLVQMDVPTRQSFVMAVVRPEERTYASGVTHIVRMGGWAVAPALSGLFSQNFSPKAPILTGCVIKMIYDGVLYFVFRKAKAPEEA